MDPQPHLAEGRDAHSSWQTDQGLVLMGGYDSPVTREILPMTGEQGGPGFAMQYDTRYRIECKVYPVYTIYFTGRPVLPQT